jgi:hypothetical protein
MKAERAVEDVRAWVDFLKTEHPYDEETRGVLIETGEKDLAQLVASADSRSP